ncbi:MAG: preprotein translocase subunit YajC [Pseudomonadota bacterium]
MSELGFALLQAAPLGAVFAVLYLGFVRPQRRRLQAHRRLVKTLKPGDAVLTEAGMLGRVISLEDASMMRLQVGPGQHLTLQRRAVMERADDALAERLLGPAPEPSGDAAGD